MKHYISILLICMLFCCGCSSPSSSIEPASPSPVPTPIYDYYSNQLIFPSVSSFVSAARDTRAAENGEDPFEVASSMQEFYIPSFIPQGYTLATITISRSGYVFAYVPEEHLTDPSACDLLINEYVNQCAHEHAFRFIVDFVSEDFSVREMYSVMSPDPYMNLVDDFTLLHKPTIHGYTIQWQIKEDKGVKIRIVFSEHLSTDPFEEADRLLAYKGAQLVTLDDFENNNYTQKTLDFPTFVPTLDKSYIEESGMVISVND